VDAGLWKTEARMNASLWEQGWRRYVVSSEVAASQTIDAAGRLTALGNLMIGGKVMKTFSTEDLFKLWQEQAAPGSRRRMLIAPD
jgi:hypothetical protein